MLDELWRIVVEHREQLLLALIPVAITGILTFVFKSLPRHIANLASLVWQFIKTILGSFLNYLSLVRHIRSNRPLWEYRKAKRRQRRVRPLCLMVMNFKGGVGKTTIAANLAASFSLRSKLKVLLIDLDYQGSLTEVTQDVRDVEKSNLLSKWISWRTPPKKFEEITSAVSGIPNARLVSAQYELTDVEDNLFQRWLLHIERGGDVRTKLERVLNSEAFAKEEYDLVVFDAPPRLSIASVNALRACHYLIIPSRLQPLSAKPVAQMIRYLKKFTIRVGSDFKVLGVVKSMTRNEGAPTNTETPSILEIETALSELPYQARVFRTQVPDRVFIGRPPTAPIAYLLDGPDGRTAREVFDKLADEIQSNIGKDFPSIPAPAVVAAS